MISLLPGSSPMETAGAYAVLALIANPQAAKKRLDELVKAAEDAKEQVEKASELAAKAAHDGKAAEQKLHRAEQQAEKNAKERERLEALAAGLVVKENELSDRAAAWGREYNRQKGELDAATALLEGERANNAVRDRQFIKDRAKFDEDRAALDRKIQKLREATAA